ncbi:hypothetical protein G9298_28530 (plasmid) [Bacillus thuringiensis]|uniref:hypothetical protein n=1 Tax=Bacillus wiedmannii TaxID=1890302 RepID=UPI000D087921|nr:hypothetical protein [Bacillus wiedmannii]PRT15846.1 hypothetical protein C6360_27365 [Bacillus wiedmannii]QPW51549.1 hypothetical protein G9298_28530 [Bacillus thuringiensis]
METPTQFSILDIINQMEPKIRKSLRLTNQQDREDLEQEIKLKIIEVSTNNIIRDTPGFWEYRRIIENN